MFIKLCGMTRKQDVEMAASCGADAVGFIFAPSPRQVTPQHVQNLTRRFKLLKVGVFVNEDIERVRDIRHQCGLDVVQLHGDESPDYCDKLGGRLFKAFRLKDLEMIARFADYPPHIKVLLDAFVQGQAGGTGKQIDRRLLDNVSDFSRIILAGGVGPDSALDLIMRYRPFGIDVNSKVEVRPGIKDHDKIRKLLFQSRTLFFDRASEPDILSDI